MPDKESLPGHGSNVDPEASAATAPLAPNEEVTGLKLIVMVIGLSLAIFLIMLDVSLVSTTIPKITDEFHALKDVGWYASSYQLGSAVVQPLTGKIFNNFSLKWTFILFFGIFELGSALSGAAQSSAMFIISRAVSGIGASGLINGGITILSASVPLEKRAPLTGVVMGISQLGVVLGPLIGGAFTTGVTWRWCFYINLPLGAVVAASLMLLHIPEQVHKDPPLAVLRQLPRYLDLVGFVLFAPFIVMLLLAMQFGGNEFAWNSSQIIGLFVGSGATLIVWGVWNWHKGEDALIPFSVIRRRRVWMSGINYTFLTTTLLGTTLFMPIYFQAVKGVTAVMSGVYMLSAIIPQLIGALVGGLLVNKVGFIPAFSISGAALFTISSGLLTMLQPDTSTGKWVGYQIIGGFGRGVSFQMPIVAVQYAVSAEELSAGMAFIVWCQYLGPSIFVTLFNTIFDTELKAKLPQYAPNVKPQVILAAGATGFRKVIAAADIPGVLKTYAESIDIVFYMTVATALVCCLSAWGMGFDDIRKTNNAAKAAAAEATAAASTGGAKGETVANRAAADRASVANTAGSDRDERAEKDQSDASGIDP